MTDRIAPLRPSELTPAERSTAVALLATGLLRHLHPAAFPPPAAANSQEKQGQST